MADAASARRNARPRRRYRVLPGFRAEIDGTNVPGGTPLKISANKVMGRTTSFSINPGAPKRYYVVWITKFASGKTLAHVNEVRAFKP